MTSALRLPRELQHCRAFLGASPAAQLLYLQLRGEPELHAQPGLDLVGTVALGVFGFGADPRDGLQAALEELQVRGLVALETERLVVLKDATKGRDPEATGPRGGKGAAYKQWAYRQRKAALGQTGNANGNGNAAVTLPLTVTGNANGNTNPPTVTVTGNANGNALPLGVTQERKAPPSSSPSPSPLSPLPSSSPSSSPSEKREAPVRDGARAREGVLRLETQDTPRLALVESVSQLEVAVLRVLRSDLQLAPIVTDHEGLARRLADRETFPGIDALAEVHKAAAWLAANPAQRKKNGNRFLTNWLSKAQERSRATGRPVHQRGGYIPAPPPEVHQRERERLLAAGAEDCGDGVVYAEGAIAFGIGDS